MARIRSIKPEFPQLEWTGRVSRDSRLLFLLLHPICDDEGRTRGGSRMLASILCPYDSDAPSSIDAWLKELEREKAIVRYTIGVDHYLAITNWEEFQKVDHPTKSKLPPPPSLARNARKLARVREASGLDQGSKDQGSKEPTFDAFWTVCAKKVGKGAATDAFEKACTKVAPSVLIAAMARYGASRKNEDQKFTKHPTTWLNQECWSDETGAAGAATSPPKPIHPSWDGHSGALIELISEPMFRTYFSRVEFAEGPPIRLIAKNEFYRATIEKRFGSEIRRCYGESTVIDLAAHTIAA